MLGKGAKNKDGVVLPVKSDEEKRAELDEAENISDFMELQIAEKKEKDIQALMAECIILTPYRLVAIRHGKLVANVLREEMRAVRHYPSGMTTFWEKLAITLNDGSEVLVQIYSTKVTIFLQKILSMDLVHCPQLEGKDTKSNTRSKNSGGGGGGVIAMRQQPTGSGLGAMIEEWMQDFIAMCVGPRKDPSPEQKLKSVQDDLEAYGILKSAADEKLLMHVGHRNTRGWIVTNERLILIKDKRVWEDVPRSAIRSAAATKAGAFSNILVLTLEGSAAPSASLSTSNSSSAIRTSDTMDAAETSISRNAGDEIVVTAARPSLALGSTSAPPLAGATAGAHVRKYSVWGISEDMCKAIAAALNKERIPCERAPVISQAAGPRHPDNTSTSIYAFAPPPPAPTPVRAAIQAATTSSSTASSSLSPADFNSSPKEDEEPPLEKKKTGLGESLVQEAAEGEIRGDNEAAIQRAPSDVGISAPSAEDVADLD
eukprot:gb/GEZN01006562.1/.p1 GENE.gb/GEZN01006562.1/~~gb/GEZN01006562.1/.p1  ORF type:complete len:528 (+),score=93.95 gb/GEZN01006562.1/:128-1585(+)